MSRMKQWLDFWEKCKRKKGSPVLIGLLVGLLLLVITWPDNSSKKQNTQAKTNAPAVENNVRNTEDLAQERTQRMEQRLEEVLREVDGVGEVKVMITLRSCGKGHKNLKQSKYTGSVRRQKHGGCTGFRREHGF